MRHLNLSTRTMLVLGAIAILSCALLLRCFRPPRIETNARKYPATLNNWRPSGLVDHFPNPLPAAATKIRFSAFPGFLQGGGWIQIRLELTAPAVTNVFADASQHAKQYHDGGGAWTLVNQRKNGLASAHLHASNSDPTEFPADYRVFIFDAKPYQTDPVFWNHGTSKGIAVSRQRNEVVYWAERW